MRMKRFYALPVLALALFAGACDEGLTEVNENPNAPESVPAENLLAGAIRNAAAGNGQYGAFGYWNQFYHSEIWVQHAAQSQYNDEDKYTPRSGVNQNIWVSFYDAQNDLKRTQALALEEGNNNLWAVAEIMSVYTWQVMTDLFGDIPYTEALRLDEGITAPKFDTQASIYTSLLARLAAVQSKINPTENVLFDTGDLVYNGDMQGWLEFSNALTLRVAMRMSNTDQSAAARTAFAAAWSRDKFDSNADNADITWSASQPGVSPVNQLIVLGGRTGDFRLSATLVDTLNSLGDPRVAVYGQPSVNGGVYRGLPNGSLPAQLGRTINDYSQLGEYFLEPDAPSTLLSFAEQQLLGAEAAKRGWIGGGDATAAMLYTQGVTNALTQFGISGAAAAAYVAQPRVAYDAATGLTQIHLQKWLHLFAAGPEAWSEWRRTNVPNLRPAANATIPTIPVRIQYPPTEGLYNPNFADYKTITIQNRVWWDVN